MTTIVNTPAPSDDAGGNSMLIGVIFFIGFIMVLLYFGIPAVQRMNPTQITIPAPQIVVPNKIDVNVVAPTK